MKKIVLLFLSGFLLLLNGCIKQEKVDTSEPAIKVNERIITENMISDSLNEISSFDKKKTEDLKKPENKFIYLLYQNKAINDLIIKELINAEADKRNISVKQKEVDAKLNEIIETIGGKSQFESALALNNINKKTFKTSLKYDILKEKLVQNIAVDLKVDEKEVKAFYEKNKEEYFNRPDLVKASHILIMASEDDIKTKIKAEKSSEKLTDEEIEKKVQAEMQKRKNEITKIMAELKKQPEKFAELAKKHSQDPSSGKKGGDLGFFSKEEMVPEFSDAAFSTKPGEISKIVQTEFGYHIIKVVDRKKAGYVPFDEVKTLIEKRLIDGKKVEVLTTLIKSSKESAEIVYLNEAYDLKNIEAEIRQLIKEKQVKGQQIKK